MKKLSLEELTGREPDGTEVIENQPVNQVQDVISYIAVNELLNEKKIKTISRINKEQIRNLTKLFLFAEVYKTPFASSLAKTILELQISLNGLGRQELVQLVQQRSEQIITERVEKKGIFK